MDGPLYARLKSRTEVYASTNLLILGSDYMEYAFGQKAPEDSLNAHESHARDCFGGDHPPYHYILLGHTRGRLILETFSQLRHICPDIRRGFTKVEHPDLEI